MSQPSSNKSTPTPAQLAIVHVIQSAGLSALVTLLTAIAQYLSSGNVDAKTLLTVLGGGFLTGLTMVWKTVSSNPQAAQAALDTANEALRKVEQLAPWLASDVSKITRAVQPGLSPSQSVIAQQPTANVPVVQAPQPIVFPQLVRESTPPPAQFYQASGTAQSYPGYNLATGQVVPPAATQLPPQQRGG